MGTDLQCTIDGSALRWAEHIRPAIHHSRYKFQIITGLTSSHFNKVIDISEACSFAICPLAFSAFPVCESSIIGFQT